MKMNREDRQGDDAESMHAAGDYRENVAPLSGEVDFDDVSDSSHLAQSLATYLADGQPSGCDCNETSLVVALTGAWGSGKTHFLKAVEAELGASSDGKPRSNVVQVVKFDPWAFETEQQMLSQFFSQLAQAVRAFGEDKSKNDNQVDWRDIADQAAVAIQYIGFIVSGVVASGLLADQALIGALGLISKALQETGSFWDRFRERSKRKKKPVLEKNTNEGLYSEQKKIARNNLDKMINSRVVVLIDNIDRLNYKRAELVFRLVAAVADFPQVSYLLAFDRDAAAKAVASVQTPRGIAPNRKDGEEYLEKIVSQWIPLPHFDVKSLLEMLFCSSEHLEGEASAAYERGLSFDFFADAAVRTMRRGHRLYDRFRAKDFFEEDNCDKPANEDPRYLLDCFFQLYLADVKSETLRNYDDVAKFIGDYIWHTVDKDMESGTKHEEDVSERDWRLNFQQNLQSGNKDGSQDEQEALVNQYAKLVGLEKAIDSKHLMDLVDVLANHIERNELPKGENPSDQLHLDYLTACVLYARPPFEFKRGFSKVKEEGVVSIEATTQTRDESDPLKLAMLLHSRNEDNQDNLQKLFNSSESTVERDNQAENDLMGAEASVLSLVKRMFENEH